MSVALNSIDCPCLTEDCLTILNKQYSISTTNDFALWLIQSNDKKNSLSSNTIECIQSCILAYTASISSREISDRKSYKLNFSFFDDGNFLQNYRHLIFIYEDFTQYQWNEFFNIFLLRLFLANSAIKIKYLNTNISLFDIKYFSTNYCHCNEVLESCFYFQHCFDLETFEKELNSMENNREDWQILIIDDFFSLIKPYLNLDRRIKSKILQLTYRLNYLAQKQSLLIVNGIILNTKKRINRSEENFLLIDDIRFDTFQADKYILFQSLTTLEKDISVRILNDKYSTLDLDDWRRI